MKKAGFAALASIVLMASACSEKTETIKPQPIAADGAATTTCNIRYIDVDSVLLGYTLAQELILEQQKEVSMLENQARQKESELQRLEASIQSKVRNNGYLSEASLNSDVAGLQQRQQEAGQWLNTHQDRIARLVAAQQQRINDSIYNFLRDYNAVYNYDAILDKKSGFFKDELDITKEVIEGLNLRYSATK